MKKTRKIATTLVALALLGTSIGGYAMASGKNNYFGGGRGYQFGPQSKNYGNGFGRAPKSDAVSGTRFFMEIGLGLGQVRGLNGPVHEKKYMQLLFGAYAPELKSSVDAIDKAENDLIAQRDALIQAGTQLDRTKIPQMDQTSLKTTFTAQKALNAAIRQLGDAVEADKSADINTALKAIVTARQSLLALEQAKLDALKKAIYVPTPSPVVTVTPTIAPTVAPTATPTVAPTTAPTVAPTASATTAPSATASPTATVAPTATPAASASAEPTASATVTSI